MNMQYHILFINLLMGMEIISILAIINIVINILEQVFFEHLFSDLWDMYPGVELLVHFVILCLRFLGTAKHFLHNGCIILHSYQHCMRVPIAPRICRRLLFSVYLLWPYKWYSLWFLFIFH